MTSGIFELSFIILIAAGLGVLAKLLKQPLILGYLAAGALIGYFNLFPIREHEAFQVFADLGIMFLLFLVGMEINYSSLRLVGRPSLIVGLGQIIFTFIIGFFLALAFAFPLLPSAYIAIALTFSSTIIVVKLLSDKKDTNSLYGKISIGVLLVQDFIAILLLIILAAISEGNGLFLEDIFVTIMTGLVLFALAMWLGKTLMPLLFDVIARSHELLFLISLAWVFLIVSLVKQLGFSIEIGGFLAGIALANASEHYQIANRIRPLRDFFIVIFFVILGSLLLTTDFAGITLPVIVFSLFVLIGNPLIVLILMGFMGYRKRTSFLTGLTVAQISEFSLVLAVLGLKAGHLSTPEVALITTVGIITITLSSYMIVYASILLRFFYPILSFFERKKTSEEDLLLTPIEKPIVLVGYNRIGSNIAHYLPKEKLFIIDFDPEMIENAKRENISYLFDDVTDPEVIEKIPIAKTRLIISTSPDFDDNAALLAEIKKRKEQKRYPKLILRAETREEARSLYDQGADYVFLPPFNAGYHLGKLINRDKNLSSLTELREKDLASL
ncbi:MAG: cation:proton antiporter [Candidatus Colwellbacteria bacterium]|nr:cation:proton antiporter [Candidatus Colwellbacteria bacterium]